jgi:hypothetical protein
VAFGLWRLPGHADRSAPQWVKSSTYPLPPSPRALNKSKQTARAADNRDGSFSTEMVKAEFVLVRFAPKALCGHVLALRVCALAGIARVVAHRGMC